MQVPPLLNIVRHLRDQPAIVGGMSIDFTYGDRRIW